VFQCGKSSLKSALAIALTWYRCVKRSDEWWEAYVSGGSVADRQRT